jgi:hypothetical protein
VDVPGGTPFWGTQLIQWPFHDSSNQWFLLNVLV